MEKVRAIPKKCLILMISLYRVAISPLLGPRCRYYPSCSSYAITAISRFGVFKGSWLAIWRLLRCNPLSDGGIDEVPCKRGK